MKGHTQYNNDLQRHRYSITTSCNDILFKVTSHVVASSYMELFEVNLTYDELDDLLQAEILGVQAGNQAPPANALQQLRNFRTSLNGFLASVGKTTASRVGNELTSGFDGALNGYLDVLDVAATTKRDRRSHLKRYRALYQAQRANNEKSRPKRVTTLSETLRAAIARTDMAPKTFARKVGVSVSAVQRYLAGALPNRRGIPGLRRMEVELGLERDSLISLVKFDEVANEAGKARDSEFSQRLAERTADRYFLPLDYLGPAFKQEWRELLAYKTSISPELERSAKGVWRCIPAATTTIDSAWVMVGNAVCPAAEMVLDRMRALFGFLVRPIESGGHGMFSGTVQTLAWLAVPSATNGYLEFLTQRSAGLVHLGQANFARFVASMVRPETGYLRQCPELRFALPSHIQPPTEDGWQRLCDEAYKHARQWIQRAKDMSREPDAPIAALLALDAPLKPVLEAIERINLRAAAAPSGGISQARHKRDALLFAFVISNPLRLRTLQSLTWSPDNTGAVYKTTTGWRVRLTRAMLKNGHGKAGKRYDVAVAPWVGEMLEAYVEEYRTTILGASESAYLFVNNRYGRMWSEMSRHVRRLTEQHVKGTTGFSLHAFRHLVATDLLKRHPNSFITAAELLNDSLETVMRCYAHLKRDDSFAIHHQYLEGLLREGRK